MIRGVFIKIIKRIDRILVELLNGINIGQYKWYNVKNQKEAWCLENGEKDEFLKDIYYHGKDFEKIINRDHYLIFLKLEVFGENVKKVNIHTYEEFQNSDCQILILIYDCNYIELFSKEKDIIQSIYANLKEKDFAEVEYITDKNDERYVLDIL